jgi:hypothetical protein
MKGNGEVADRDPKVLSQGLVSIVAVVYGLGLVNGLTMHPDVVLNPQRASYIVPALALFAALLLTSYSFFGFVLTRSDEEPYSIIWTTESSGWIGAIDFAADLLIAGLYVRLITAALEIPLSSGPHLEPVPNLKPFIVSLVPLFAVALIVRLLRAIHRGKPKLPILVTFGALVGSALLTFDAYNSAQTRRTDLGLGYILTAATVAYIVLNDAASYRAWKRAKQRIAGKPEDDGAV